MAMKVLDGGERGVPVRSDRTTAPKFDLTVTEPLDRWRRAVLGLETARRRHDRAVVVTDKEYARDAVTRARGELAKAKRDFENAFLASIDLGDA